MTLSIIARCPATGEFGVAAATALPAVGKLLTHAHPGAGAVATQAWINPYLGIDGIEYLSQGHTASEVAEILKGDDPRADIRQFAVVDRHGRVAVWTGESCSGWAGAAPGEGYCVQGNRLTGPEVLKATAEAFEGGGGALVDRLVASLAAGLEAGGDLKGERSATVYVVATEEYPLWDIRVDDHPDPVAELVRLKKVFAEDLIDHIRDMPSRARFAGGAGDYNV